MCRWQPPAAAAAQASLAMTLFADAWRHGCGHGLERRPVWMAGCLGKLRRGWCRQAAGRSRQLLGRVLLLQAPTAGHGAALLGFCHDVYTQVCCNSNAVGSSFTVRVSNCTNPQLRPCLRSCPFKRVSAEWRAQNAAQRLALCARGGAARGAADAAGAACTSPTSTARPQSRSQQRQQHRRL